MRAASASLQRSLITERDRVAPHSSIARSSSGTSALQPPSTRNFYGLGRTEAPAFTGIADRPSHLAAQADTTCCDPEPRRRRWRRRLDATSPSSPLGQTAMRRPCADQDQLLLGVAAPAWPIPLRRTRLSRQTDARFNNSSLVQALRYISTAPVLAVRQSCCTTSRAL